MRAHFSRKRKEDDFTTALLAAAGGKAVLRGGCAEGSEWKLHSDYHQVFRVPLPRLVLHRFVFFCSGVGVEADTLLEWMCVTDVNFFTKYVKRALLER